jgi:hypothetical protein
MWSLRWSTARSRELFLKDAALVPVERGEARELYAIFGLTRQS